MENATALTTAAAGAAGAAATGGRAPTLTQVALFLVWLAASVSWAGLSFLLWRRERATHAHTIDYQLVSRSEEGEGERQAERVETPKDAKVPHWQDVQKICEFLRSIAVFGLIMYFFYLGDYQKVFPRGDRTYSRDWFIFIFIVIFGFSYTTRTHQKDDTLLNRDQTEEWKGWMQTMFVFYHYFKAGEVYNAIRVFIASYVWMTGFGNFLYFQKRKDFSIIRVLKMLFRLNFMVVFVCATVDTEYLLYYICPMHTFWFFVVYIFMYIGQTHNDNPRFMYTKFAVLFSLCVLIWDVPSVGETIFRPFYFILGYEGSLHEWMFRSGLDHFATPFGMLTAYHFDGICRFLTNFSDQVEPARRYGNMFGLGAVCAVVIGLWYNFVYCHDKFTYNTIHPYTSFIPISVYVILRNVTPTLRSYYLSLFSWLGKITLETYLSQLHIYMQSSAKDLIVYIPGYPLVNFVLATAIYVYMSYTVFHLTTDMNNFLFPSDLKQIGIQWAGVGVIVAVSYGFAAIAYPMFID
eukprot:comp8283_c0_seq1/m.3693 comp8283_c0_seq1/g.3693  ORF comp8283_c0_seq1/g.3693 comp8283_c0_seq1/m.3693 type:complete len:520 (-) comp8283_c0_seq1:387-1946(-)